jgi:hypothetical protein
MFKRSGASIVPFNFWHFLALGGLPGSLREETPHLAKLRVALLEQKGQRQTSQFGQSLSKRNSQSLGCLIDIRMGALRRFGYCPIHQAQPEQILSSEFQSGGGQLGFA